MPHWSLGKALVLENTWDALGEASIQYRIAERLMPNCSVIHRELGEICDDYGYYSYANNEYRLSIQLDPFTSKNHDDLAYDLKISKKFTDALPEFKTAMMFDPWSSKSHTGLSEMYAMQNDTVSAVKEFQNAVNENYFDTDAWGNLCCYEDHLHHPDECLRAGREMTNILSTDTTPDAGSEASVHDAMSDAYLQKKQWNNSIAESHVALSYVTSDVLAKGKPGRSRLRCRPPE